MSILATGGQSRNRMTGGGDIIPKGMQKGRIQQFTPEQMKLFQQLFGHLGPDSFLNRLAGGDEGAFEEMEKPAHREFESQMGQLGSRFSGLGMGAQRGSGFNLAGNQAASDFAQDLASKRMGIQRDALRDLMGFSNDLMNQHPFENFITNKQKKSSFLERLLSALAGGAGSAIGGMF